MVWRRQCRGVWHKREVSRVRGWGEVVRRDGFGEKEEMWMSKGAVCRISGGCFLFFKTATTTDIDTY